MNYSHKKFDTRKKCNIHRNVQYFSCKHLNFRHSLSTIFVRLSWDPSQKKWNCNRHFAAQTKLVHLISFSFQVLKIEFRRAKLMFFFLYFCHSWNKYTLKIIPFDLGYNEEYSQEVQTWFLGSLQSACVGRELVECAGLIGGHLGIKNYSELDKVIRRSSFLEKLHH